MAKGAKKRQRGLSETELAYARVALTQLCITRDWAGTAAKAITPERIATASKEDVEFWLKLFYGTYRKLRGEMAAASDANPDGILHGRN